MAAGQEPGARQAGCPQRAVTRGDLRVGLVADQQPLTGTTTMTDGGVALRTRLEKSANTISCAR